MRLMEGKYKGGLRWNLFEEPHISGIASNIRRRGGFMETKEEKILALHF